MTEQGKSQDQVLSFLAGSAAHGGQKVKRIDTHAASVFLTPERALKVKRAVKFPFLDYSTLAKRKAACEAEIEVNRPFAADLYRGVVAITRGQDGRLAIGGHGEPVEWAVEMARFDEHRTLDHMAHEIDGPLADALGRAVASAHAKAHPVDRTAPWIEALGSYIDEHVDAFRLYPNIFPPADVATLARHSRAAYERIVPLLRERGRQGFVRRIHGDLHLGNIVLIDGKPVLFDAIEFSAVIATGDVLYDLAFLLMDLWQRGQKEAANIVFNRYIAQAQCNADFDALTMLPFFLSIRAAIRAKVTAARLNSASAEEKAEISNSAGAYFGLALRALAPPKPILAAVGGLSGTGKSRLARALASDLLPMPGAVVIRSDVERKALFKVAETDRLPKRAYDAEINEQVYAILLDKARHLLAAGHSALIDAVFARPSERHGVAGVAASNGIPLWGLFLTADLASRLVRIGRRGPDASDADEAVAQTQQHYDVGSIGWAIIDASGTPENTLELARKALELR